MQDLTIKKIEEKHGKDGKSTFYAVFGEGGEEMTTFDVAINQLQIGSIISVEPKVSGKYINIEKWKLKQGATAQIPPPSSNGKDMPPEYWENKQRIERASFEAQTAYNGIIKLLESKVLELSHATAKKALDWAETKFDSESPPRTATKKTETKQAEQPTETPAEGLTFKNVGEFLAACNNAGVPRNKVMEKLGVDEKNLPRINITESWDIIYEEIIKPSKELME